jgi:thiamine-monophosphate kinase
VGLIGGDTVTTKGPMIVTVAIHGYSDLGVVSRAGAKEGDVVVVTGALGGSLHDGRHGDFEPCLSEASRLMEIAVPHSMTDISDGLARDLSNILEASGVGAVIESSAIPVHPSACSLSKQTGRPALWHALNDGEDFELLFTMDRAAFTRVQSQWNLPTPLTVIGCIEGEGLLLAEGQQRSPLLPGGFEHGVK